MSLCNQAQGRKGDDGNDKDVVPKLVLRSMSKNSITFVSSMASMVQPFSTFKDRAMERIEANNQQCNEQL